MQYQKCVAQDSDGSITAYSKRKANWIMFHFCLVLEATQSLKTYSNNCNVLFYFHIPN